MEDEDKNSKSLVLITRVGSTPTTGIKRKPSSLSGGLPFYLRRVSGSNSTTLHSRGAISPAGCCSVRGRPPPPAWRRTLSFSWGSFLILLKSSGNLSLAALGMMAVMLPLFFLAMYEKDGQPLEVVAKHFYEAKFKRPKTRPYKTKNYYAPLVQQADVEMEVNRIVQNGKKQER